MRGASRGVGLRVSVASSRSLVWGCSMLVAPLLLAAVAQPAQARAPDLVVPFAQLTSKPWVFKAPAQAIAFQDRTKNQGGAKAGASLTRLLVTQQPTAPTLGFRATIRNVFQLAAGTQSSGSANDTWDLSNRAFGGYYTNACADWGDHIAESDETNNCSFADRLSVTPRRWSGTVKGSGVLYEGVKETWTADVTFKFDPDLSSPGSLWYEPFGTVHYKTSGTDSNGCTVSGSGSVAGNQDGGIQITHYFKDYHGIGSTPNTWSGYPVHVSGGAGCSGTINGPFHVWFYTGPPSTPKPITPRFGATGLDDTYNYAAAKAKYGWNLPASP